MFRSKFLSAIPLLLFSVILSSCSPTRHNETSEKTPVTLKSDLNMQDVTKVQNTIKDNSVAPPLYLTETEKEELCNKLGVRRTPFNDTDQNITKLGDVVGDALIPTSVGDYSLKAGWSGCSSYIFVDLTQMFNDKRIFKEKKLDMDLARFVNGSQNAVYFFGFEDDMNSNEAKSNNFDQPKMIAELQQNFQKEFDKIIDDKEKNKRQKNIFFLDHKGLKSIKGKLGDFFTKVPGNDFKFYFTNHGRLARPWGYGLVVTPFQTIDNIGSFHFAMPPMRSAEMVGTISRLPEYYTYQFIEKQKEDEQKNVLEITLFDKTMEVDKTNDPFSFNNQHFTVVFPSKKEMKLYNKLQFEITQSCGLDWINNCGEWDFEAFLQRCDNPDCNKYNEILRWITPYAKIGIKTFYVDGTPFLPFFKNGGKQYFNFAMLWYMNTGHYTIKARLYNDPNALTPFDITPLFTGSNSLDPSGFFNSNYNSKYKPFRFRPPLDAKRVDVVGIISTHGQDESSTKSECGEWCPNEHHFSVGGKTFTQVFNWPLTYFGCADRARFGVPPGQQGNWAPARPGAWCPGQAISPFSFDITDTLKTRAVNRISYHATWGGGKQPPATDPKNNARIRMASYIVSYR